MIRRILAAVIVLLLFFGFFYRHTIQRLYQGYQDTRKSKERAKLYTVDDDSPIKDITVKLISDEMIPQDLKLPLIKSERRIIVFKYLSGSEYVAGYLSLLTDGPHPTMVFLRGGNQYYGIMRPNNRFSFFKGHNIVGTLYRGNMYGGFDEFGGDDIQDVENLLRFIPTLEKYIHTKIAPPYVMMGVSRGAMEMFISLSRSDFVKSKITHAISISGNVDLKVSMKNRSEMDYFFRSLLKKSKFKSLEDWLKVRNPTDNVSQLSTTLKILQLYGSADNRVSLEEQNSFKDTLDKHGVNAELLIIPEANHGLDDHYEELENYVTRFLR